MTQRYASCGGVRTAIAERATWGTHGLSYGWREGFRSSPPQRNALDGAAAEWSRLRKGSCRPNARRLIGAAPSAADDLFCAWTGTTTRDWAAKLILWHCNSKWNQVFEGGGWGHPIVNTTSGHVVDVPGGTGEWGTQLIMWDRNGGANQGWWRI